MLCKVSQFVKQYLLAGCLLSLFLILAPTAWAQVSAFEAQPGQIRGTVLFEGNHRPAGAVIVNLNPLSGGPSASVLTDLTGRFEVRGLPPGTYEIAAEERGYESTRATAQSNNPLPGLVLYLKSANTASIRRTRLMVSVRELKIPGKAHDAFENGVQCLTKNDAAASLAYFTKATAAFPDYYEAYYHAGVAEMRLGRNEQAMQAFQKAIDLSGGRYAWAQFSLGVLLLQQDKPDEAQVVIRRGLELGETSLSGRFLLGVSLLRLDRLEEAEQSARETLVQEPSFAKAYLLLSDVHARKADYPAQVLDLDAYLTLEPAGPANDLARRTREVAQRMASRSTPQN